MTVIVKFNLRGSAQHESPETMEKIVRARIESAIRQDRMMGIFIAGYSVEVIP